MSDFQLKTSRTLKQIDARLDRQNGNQYSPSLGEFYATFLGLPGLRGFWPLSSVDNTGAIIDLSGQNRTLSNSGAPPPVYTIAASGLYGYYSLNGTSAYLSRASEAGLTVTGALTVGGWYQTNSLTAAGGLHTKSDGVTPNNNNWELLFRGDLAGDPVQFNVANVASTYTVNSTNTVAQSAWFFAVGRYTPSTEVAVFLDNIKTVNTTGIPASINSSTAQFSLGSRNAGVLLAGVVGPGQFLCAGAMSDELINYLWMRTAPIFQI